MTNGEAIGNPPALITQRRLQEEALEFIQDGNFSEATSLMVEAGQYRDTIVTSKTSDVWPIEASISFNEAFHTLLNGMVTAGQIPAAEGLVSERLRSTVNPYEAHGLYYWAAMHEAAKGNFRIAWTQAGTSEEVALSIGSHWLAAQTENLLSRICSDCGDEEATRKFLEKALDNVELGETSDLYVPERYRYQVGYGVKHRLRFYLGQRLFYGREREARHFCNEILTRSAHPSRRGFLHYWMGQAELLHPKPTGKSGRYSDTTKATLHLMAAEDCFVMADEPVYAAFVVLDQMYLGDKLGALRRASHYVSKAVEQYELLGVSSLLMELDHLVRQFREAEQRTLLSNN